MGRWLRPAVPLAIAGSGLAAECVGLWGRMADLYAGGATGWELLRRLASLQPWGAGDGHAVRVDGGEI